MATAALVTGGAPGAPNHNPVKDESMATAGGAAGGDLSAEIAEQESVLKMVDGGFDEDRIFESREYQFSMDMIADSKLRGN